MFNMLVTPDDPATERFEVVAGMRDLVIWERTHKGRSLSQVGDGALTAGMLYEIAFSACTRQHLIPRGMSAPDFFDGYEVEVETDAERAARTNAEALRARIRDGVVPAPTEIAPDEQAEVPDREAGGADPTQSAA